MNYFTKLFTKAPFDYIQLHMEKVTCCLSKLKEIFTLLDSGDLEQIRRLSEKVSDSEHEADLIKNDIRTSLPKSFLFPVDRGNFLEMLTIQDNLADICEDVSELLSIKKIELFDEIRDILMLYVEKNANSVTSVKEIVMNFDELLEASFGGTIAEKTKIQINETIFKEHEVELLKRKLIRIVFNHSKHLSNADFYLWIRLIEEMGTLSHMAEKLALRIGMLVDFK